MLKRDRTWLFILACAALSVPAAAGEFELGGDGYAFTLRDTPYKQGTGGGYLDMGGLGWSTRAALIFDGGAQRVSVVVRSTRDDVHESWTYRYSRYDYIADTRLAFVSVDARYEPRVVASERLDLRLQTGYRFAHGTQTVRRNSHCPTCPTPRSYSLDQDRRTGHGIRTGLAADVHLVGPLHLESEAGLSLLAATDRNVDSGSSYTNRSSNRRSAATWDVSARLRAEWKAVSVGVGYRFDRWALRPWSTYDVGFDGFTFGLGLRFGL